MQKLNNNSLDQASGGSILDGLSGALKKIGSSASTGMSKLGSGMKSLGKSTKNLFSSSSASKLGKSATSAGNSVTGALSGGFSDMMSGNWF